ncbi:MAG: dephospho-CoA kinase [Clostridia bacterium]|nr:dephospho-CoA kinase [Clostridia bacterium]
MKKKIAITGGIGSGKSEAIKIIKELGFSVFSCDEIYKEVILSKEYVQEIEKNFPTCVKSGKIDRTELANIVFNQPEKRDLLNRIAHPLIMKELLSKMQQIPDDFIFAEVPLLFEGGYESLFDYIFIITRSKKERIQSVTKRDNLSKEEILKRMDSQFNYNEENLKEVTKHAGVQIISNAEDLVSFKEKITKEISKLKQS